MGKITFKSWGAVVLLVSSSVSYAGWADELSKGLGVLNSVLGSSNSTASTENNNSTGRSRSNVGGFIQPTANQKLAIANKLKNANVYGGTAKALVEAAPTLQAFLETVSCSNVYGMENVGRYTTLNASKNKYSFSGAMEGLHYHPNSQCMTVTQIGNFTMPALNALKLQVMFVSDVSGESAARAYLLIKQDDGSWLVDNASTPMNATF